MDKGGGGVEKGRKWVDVLCTSPLRGSELGFCWSGVKANTCRIKQPCKQQTVSTPSFWLGDFGLHFLTLLGYYTEKRSTLRNVCGKYFVTYCSPVGISFSFFSLHSNQYMMRGFSMKWEGERQIRQILAETSKTWFYKLPAARFSPIN